MSDVVIPGYNVEDLRFLVRGGTAANLAAVNEIPFVRELIVERDTLKMKLGDGINHYNDLAYISTGGGGGSTWRNGTGAPSDSLGANGDYYLDDATGDVYAKAAGTYTIVANIKGTPGVPGSSSGQVSLGAGDRANPVPLGIKALTPVTMACDIVRWVMVIATDDDASGDVEVDVRRVSYADFASGRPNVGDSILAAPLEIVAGMKANGDDTDFTDIGIDQDDILAMIVISRSSNVTHVALAINTEKT